MPKRLLDSSLFGSPSLGACSPRAQDAFPRFILLADDFGCFHANPRVLLGQGWPLRSDVSEDDLRAWIGEYIAAGMLRAWEAEGRVYAFLTGWNGRHGQRERKEYDPETAKHGSKRRTPRPPDGDCNYLKTLPAREIGGNVAGTSRELEIPGNFPPTQSQSQSHLLAGASRAAPEEAPPRPEQHVAPPPTSGREDKPASFSQQPILAADVAPGATNAASTLVPAPPAKKPRQKTKETPEQATAFVALRDRLVSVYEEVRKAKYAFQGAKDANAVKRLLEVGDADDVEARWRKALNIPAGYLRANGIADFASKWNSYPGAPANGSAFKPFDRGGRASAEDTDWTRDRGAF